MTVITMARVMFMRGLIGRESEVCVLWMSVCVIHQPVGHMLSCKWVCFLIASRGHTHYVEPKVNMSAKLWVARGFRILGRRMGNKVVLVVTLYDRLSMSSAERRH